MSQNDQDQAQERTEKPTPKRLEDARRKGQVPRSRELSMAMIMIGASLLLVGSQQHLGPQLVALMRQGLSHDRESIIDSTMLAGEFGNLALQALWLFAPFLALCMAMAILGGVAIGGLNVSAQALAPKFSKLNPVKGLKRIFGLNGLVEVAKALAKAGLIGGVALGFLALVAGDLLALTLSPVHVATASALTLVFWTLAVSSAALAVIALLDAPYQLWNHERQLKMTRRDIRDELKETEGRPEVRARIRQLQQETAQRRMLRDVPDADVIVTNPTHFAVALRYDETSMRAPVVVARGTDLVAARIREIGRSHRVPTFEAPLLARALYWTTDIGQPIPSTLYVAVAQVLTYVFQLRRAEQGSAAWPDRPVVAVDPELAEPSGRRNGKPEVR
ncbi:MAG: flagellar biosynthesis protein FlhB [Chromatiales bacterium]|nr:flagellar biosynthesis protein FlhB [Chromatiales bacterium]